MSAATAPAAMLNFLIENNGGLHNQFHTPVSVDGEFTFDTVTLAISNFIVTFSGEGAYDIAGTYTDTSNPHFGFYNPDLPFLIFEGPDAYGYPHKISLRLSGLGDSSSPYEILIGYWEGGSLIVTDHKNPPTIGRVVSEPAVPEPSTWAMVLGAFASAAAWTRRRNVHLRG